MQSPAFLKGLPITIDRTKYQGEQTLQTICNLIVEPSLHLSFLALTLLQKMFSASKIFRQVLVFETKSLNNRRKTKN